jgi:hypothetical protein
LASTTATSCRRCHGGGGSGSGTFCSCRSQPLMDLSGLGLDPTAIDSNRFWLYFASVPRARHIRVVESIHNGFSLNLAVLAVKLQKLFKFNSLLYRWKFMLK